MFRGTSTDWTNLISLLTGPTTPLERERESMSTSSTQESTITMENLNSGPNMQASEDNTN